MSEAEKNYDEAPKVSLADDGMSDPSDIFGDDIADIEEVDEMETLRAERDDMRDRFMRALADAENSQILYLS